MAPETYPDPSSIAARIEAIRKEQGRSATWLSEKTGIPYSTLRDVLRHNPRRLRVLHVELISKALGVDVFSVLKAAS
ncbi:helix-turn-helix domain-containing protein [Gryllotalpicola koreensis]|uniref:HTH cro/C1-type domain-containing protein n=1 Tax=Gryllotalpicola koreensis TaxID=993086 RepID=A0ABP8A238_9MICO